MAVGSRHDAGDRLGAYDTYITGYARAVRRYGQPLFIRPICGEFNGYWWDWCSPKANPELTAADFVAAWRRIVDIFRPGGRDQRRVDLDTGRVPSPADGLGARSRLAGLLPR